MPSLALRPVGPAARQTTHQVAPRESMAHGRCLDLGTAPVLVLASMCFSKGGGRPPSDSPQVTQMRHRAVVTFPCQTTIFGLQGNEVFALSIRIRAIISPDQHIFAWVVKSAFLGFLDGAVWCGCAMLSFILQFYRLFSFNHTTLSLPRDC